MNINTNVSTLFGKTMEKVEQVGNTSILFYTTEGRTYMMYHDQECCEWVCIEDVCGDLQDLVGSPLTLAEEVTEQGGRDEYGDVVDWTFYKFATTNGFVTIRWYGSSNGYYSTSVDFVRVDDWKKEDEVLVQ